jgi:tetratricopeptide (TPR) repeat protein
MPAMPSPIQFQVFLSAVSSEFRNERVQLENWLERKGLHVSSQEKFNQGDSTLWKKLHDEVARCQAVICIIGAQPGWPSGGELPDNAPERSWTQWEFWLAWGEQPWSPPRREKVYVFFPDDLDARLEKARIAAAADVQRLRALDLQEIHIDGIKQTNKHYSTFKDSDDLIKQCLTLELPTIARTKPDNLPYGSLGTLFKGRDKAIEDLHRQLTMADGRLGRNLKHVIHGQGGVGKTRLAIEYALHYAKEYAALLFLMAEKPESLRQNLAALCGPLALNLPEQDAKEEETRINATLRWLQAHEGWLLIIDNVDTTEAAAQVEELVGALRGGTILITSRLTDWSAGITSRDLDVLPLEAAAEFLLERTKDRRRSLPEDESDARALAGELETLALLLEQAGAFIFTKRTSLHDYLRRWRERDQTVREWFDERLMKYPCSVVTTWDTSIQQLSPAGLSLLHQLSWLAPEPIPRSLLSEGAMQDALAELANFSLAKLDEGGTKFRIHGLVQDVTRERQTEEERRKALEAALELIMSAIPGNPQDVRTWVLWEPLRSHAMAVTAYADRYGIADPTSYLMNGLGLLLLSKARHKEAEPLIRRALAIDEVSFGPEHPHVARDLNNLAQLLQDTNRFDKAEPLIRRALAIHETSYGAEHPTVAIDLNNLARLLQDTNRLGEAEPLMQRHLCIFLLFTRSTGHIHPHLKAAFENYISLLQAMEASHEELGQRLRKLGRDAGFDEASYKRLITQLFQQGPPLLFE